MKFGVIGREKSEEFLAVSSGMGGTPSRIDEIVGSLQILSHSEVGENSIGQERRGTPRTTTIHSSAFFVSPMGQQVACAFEMVLSTIGRTRTLPHGALPIRVRILARRILCIAARRAGTLGCRLLELELRVLLEERMLWVRLA
jgi:hypothetical protein